MQTTEKQTFDSEVSLRNWLVSLMVETEGKYNAPDKYLLFEFNHEGEQVLLKTALISDSYVRPVNDDFETVLRFHWADSVVLTEQVFKDFQGRWSSCITEIPSNLLGRAPLDFDLGEVVTSKYITYSIPCFIEKVQSI